MLTESLGPAADTGKLETRKSGEGESGALQTGAGVLLTRITVSKPCRVRFYTSAAKRDLDADRDRFTDPIDYPEKAASPNHGCLSEFLMLTIVTLENIPADYLVSGDGDVYVYYRIDNYDLTAGAVTVTLTIKDVEQ